MKRRYFMQAAGLAALGLPALSQFAQAADKQGGWRRCKKCETLFNGPEFDKSVCPAGKNHNLEDNVFYLLGFDTGQKNWRYCAKCKGFWFAGSDNQGKCPAGDKHTSEGSADYAAEPDDKGSETWRRCIKCQLLWFAGDGTKGKCPAGGGHVKDEKFKYKLDREPTFATIPVTGKHAPGVEALDAIMLKYLRKINCSAASLTVTRSHHATPNGMQPTTDRAPLFSRGYGWCDLMGTIPMKPDTPIGMGSCLKSLHAAGVHQLALAGKFGMNDSVFKLLKVKPKGKVVDNRIWDITPNHLIGFTPGWQGEPLAKACAAAGNVTGYVSWYDYDAAVLSHLATQTLRDKPGENPEYNNFAFDVLDLMIQRFSKDGTAKYICNELCRPFGLRKLFDVRESGPARPNDVIRVWNYYNEGVNYHWQGKREGEPPAILVTTPGMCNFMRYFRHDGSSRSNEDVWSSRNGSWDNASAIKIWHTGGINIAAAFNGRREVDGDAFAELDGAVTQLIEKKLLPPLPKAPHNLLANSSFEEGPAAKSFVTLQPDSTEVQGWRVSRGPIDYVGDKWKAADAAHSIELHGSPGNGGIEQTFPTIIGQRYRVTFFLAGKPTGSVPIKRVVVSAAGKSQEFAFDTTGRKYDDMGWVEYTWEFEAVAQNTTLAFHAVIIEGSVGGPTLDNVRVLAVAGKK